MLILHPKELRLLLLPFFNTAFNSCFKETEIQEMELEDVYPVTFGILGNWLYKQTLEEEIGWVDDLATLLDLWLLADRFLVPRLQNQALTLLENVRGLKRPHGRPILVHMFKMIYDNASEDTPLRKYIAATWHNRVIDPDDPNDVSHYPPGLVLDYENRNNPWGTLSKYNAMGKDEMSRFFVDETVVGSKNRKKTGCSKFLSGLMMVVVEGSD